MPGKAHRIGKREPVVIGAGWLAVDLARIELPPGPRRDRDRRGEQEVVAGEEILKAPVKLGLQPPRPRRIARGITEPLLEIGPDIGPKTFRLRKLLLMRGKETHRPQHGKRLIGIAAVGVRGLERAEEGSELSHLGRKNPPDMGLGRRDAEILAHRHLEAREIERGERVELFGPPHPPPPDRRRQRIARVIGGLGGEHEGEIPHLTRHRPQHGKPRPAERTARVRHQSGRGAEAHDAAEGGWVAQAAAEIGAGGKHYHAGRERSGRAARGAGGRFLRIERVAGRAIDRVPGIGARAEFRGVGLGEDHRACRAQPRHVGLIRGGDVIGEEEASEGGAKPRRLLEVLDAEGKPLEEAERLAPHHADLRLPRRAPRPLLVEGRDSIDRRIDRTDAGERTLEDLDGGEFPRPDQAAGGECGKIAGVHGGVSGVRGRVST